ncbi:DUF4429 domain-containing protein [Streptomyces sp. H27-D2]|uniref:DUF4429 domain-containing protein n=1 Tax=Streptomyces sp. H27-D2 TaxID=3046304 RepID=UPI002DB5D045|nr:DUF4429 domain-containing protein [Streptomyces sp. H27-D2]MEC4017807.1 DUF4429 domain-containing protein [Streptomyces sp. H27-D2]
MAELMARDGTWTFDGEVIRIVPGRDRGVHKLRQLLGEIAVPLQALAGIAYEPGKKGGRLRLRLRAGADPLLHVTGGGLPEAADPYQAAVGSDRTGVAEYFADEVRNAMVVEQVPTGPCDRFLLPGPAVPLSATAVDGTATFDGERVRLEWNWMVEESKKAAGSRSFALDDLAGVGWTPAIGLESGCLRFVPKGMVTKMKPEHDPNCLLVWGFKKESGTTALLAAAVAARLPHPAAGIEVAGAGGSGEPATGDAGQEAPGDMSAPAPTREATRAPGDSTGNDHDALLRRLRELGELRRDGVLTDEEFAAAKQTVLAPFHGGG